MRRTRNGGFLHRLRQDVGFADEQRLEPARPVIATSEQRHNVYLGLLEGLTLSATHATQLVGRGLSEETIATNLYSTSPAAIPGAAIAGSAARDHECEGVPGFWRDQTSWRIAVGPGELMIPVRDAARRIVGVMLRSDDAARRYRWFSSKDRPHGAAAIAAIHYALRRSAGKAQCAIVTEGALKADVTLELCQDVDAVVGLPGIAAAFRAAKEIVDALPSLRQVFVAFDADFRTNDAVARAFRAIVSAFVDTGIRTEVMTWDLSSGKGVDDVLKAVCR